MKVLLVITKPTIGGATRNVLDLANALVDAGHDVTVYSGSPDDAWLYKNLDTRINRVVDTELVPEIGFKDIIFITKLMKFCREWRPDVLHAHSSKVGVLARIAGRIAGVRRVVFTSHGVSFQDKYSLLRRNFYLLAEKLAYHFCDRIICVSDFDRKKFLKHFKDSKAKFITIHNQIPGDIVQRQPKSNNSIFGYVGRFDFPKRPLFLVECFTEFYRSERDPSLKLKLKGDGDYLASIQEFIAREGTTFIELHPFDQHVNEFYKSLDVHVLCSDFEGYPYSLIEARNLGCGLIATDVGGCSEIITSPTIGLLYPPGDKLALIEAMRKMRYWNGSSGVAQASQDRFQDYIERIVDAYRH